MRASSVRVGTGRTCAKRCDLRRADRSPSVALVDDASPPLSRIVSTAVQVLRSFEYARSSCPRHSRPRSARRAREPRYARVRVVFTSHARASARARPPPRPSSRAAHVDARPSASKSSFARVDAFVVAEEASSRDMTDMMEAPMEAPQMEGDMQEWQEGMEAAGPLPLQTLEVRARARPRPTRHPSNLSPPRMPKDLTRPLPSHRSTASRRRT